MGILYKAVKAEAEMKREFVIDKLKELHVTKSQLGEPIEQLDYAELKYEYALASIREVDIKTPANKFF